jgi:hypothetical protein
MVFPKLIFDLIIFLIFIFYLDGLGSLACLHLELINS